MQINSDLLLFDIRRWCTPPQLSMFNLMSNCCNWVSKLQQPTRDITVLVVGLDKAGKTSCIRGMLRAPFGEVGPTHGCVHNELLIENFLVNLLDVSGSPEARAGWREYYSEAHGIIFVVDSSDRHRIKEVKDLLTDMLRQPRVAGKPLLIMANKQDKMNALLGSELIEVLSLEKLVNQSQSLCHIEPCSALMDSRRWSDRKTLRGLRWLLRAVCLDYSKLCARVVRDSRRPPGTKERERNGKTEKTQKKNKAERTKASKPEICQVPHPQQKEQKTGRSLQPIRDILKKENSFQKKMKKKKLNVKIKRKSVKKGSKTNDGGKEPVEEEVEGNEVEQDHNCLKEKANSALLPQKSLKIKPKAKVKVETLDHPESSEKDTSNTTNAKGEKKKKKKVLKGKRKNRINTEEMPAAYRQPADLSATFDLYRKAILALKARQDQSLVPEQ
ncbi:ADP-ribosylation factor-like protein 13A [Trichomycterus rosablanca]|uniref:ADP-ribosylation factor-like protein 13A n=1 Tax=Trichomycterus rosablanca TaxID=2290929 RepID=UPI002F35A8F5